MNHPQDPNEVRRIIAGNVVARERQRLGNRLIAAAIYGSVAHGAARAWSDLELLFVVSDEAAYVDDNEFSDGVMIECTFVPQTRLLRAAQRISRDWGLEADQYRHHTILYDPDVFFPRLHQAATNLDPVGFTQALTASWWLVYELLGKTRNALDDGDIPGAIFLGWEIARATALRIALHEQRPYESMRTLWRDVQTRGYGMAQLIPALVMGDTATLLDNLNAVWAVTAWEAPQGAPTPGR